VKRVGLVLHAGRPEAAQTAGWLARAFTGRGVEVYANEADAARTGDPAVIGAAEFPEELDLVLVLGGDGTLLRAVETVGERGPLLGINFGHLGFLSELERAELEDALPRVIDEGFTVDERMLLEASVGDDPPVRALNDVIVAKVDIGRSIRLAVSIGGEPFVAWAADGIIVATATGSTAYSFSAGGPVVSPRLECMVVTPVSAHGLFTRSVVVPPDEEVGIHLLPDADIASMSVDGGPAVSLDPGAHVTVRSAPEKVRLAKLDPAPFWRLVREKFLLPGDPG
jgi:NAD+ kinase